MADSTSSQTFWKGSPAVLAAEATSSYSGFFRWMPSPSAHLTRMGAVGGLHGFDRGRQNVLSATAGADAVGGGLPQDGVGDAPFVPGLAEHGEADAGPTLFHGQGRAGDVQSALGQQLLSGKGQGLRRHVVDMAAQLHDLRLLGGAAFTPKGPDTVGGGEFLFAHAVAGLLQRHDRHGAEALSKVGQQGGAGGGTQLSPDVPGVAEDALQQVGGGGSGH